LSGQDTDAPAPSFDELQARLVGQAFPGGRFSVEEHERWLSHEAMKSPPIEAPMLHPVWILLGSLRGMGLTIEELVGLAGMDPGAGVLFGETEICQIEPLRTGVEYTVTGAVTALERRQGRRAGTFDVLTFSIELALEGKTVATSTQAFILIRGAHA
jgi:hypothetical protein